MLDQYAPDLRNDGGLIYANVKAVYEQLRDNALKMRARIGNKSVGAVGAGWVTSLPEVGRHWRPDRAEKGKSYTFANIVLDELYEQPLIAFDELKRSPFLGFWWTPHRSGRAIPEPFVTALENRWSEVAARVLPAFPDEHTDAVFMEGASARVFVNRYERDRGARIGASIMPKDFSGFMTNAEMVSWFPDPDRYWVLVSGTMGGSSGRVIIGTARVFEIGSDAGSTIWSAPPRIGNIGAHTNDLGWDMVYTDSKRFYDSLPQAIFLDIYQIDYTAHSYRRFVHKALDP